MSREERLDCPEGVSAAVGDDCIEIRLKLRLDEIARLEEEELRRNLCEGPSRKQLIRLAGKIYEARQARYRVLDRKLLGEPAWDMLLALYWLPARGEVLTVTSLTYAAEASTGTGSRWQAALERDGLIERGPDLGDARRQLVRLSAKGRELMDAYLTRLFFADVCNPSNA